MTPTALYDMRRLAIRNIEALFTDLLEVMRHTVEGPLPTEEESSVISKGIVSDSCRRWQEQEPTLVECLNTQWHPKISQLTPQKWLSKVFFRGSRLTTCNMWAPRIRGSPGRELSTAQRLQVSSCSSHNIQGCSVNTTSHVEGWHCTLKVHYNWKGWTSSVQSNS